jgi:integrase
MPRPSSPWYKASRDAWISRIDGVKGRRNKAEAARVLRRLLAERDRGRKAPPGISLSATFDLFLEHTRSEKATLTYEFYLRHLRSYLDHVGWETPASEARPHTVTSWLAAHDWGETTRSGAVTAVKRAFRWARREGYLESDPMADVARPRAKVRQEVMTPDEARRFLAAIKDEPFRDLVTILRETGCRLSEAIAVEAAMVRPAEAVVVMRSKTSRKTGRDRVIHLTPTALAILERLAAEHPDGPLLRNTIGRPWSFNIVAQRFAAQRKRMGLGKGATAEALRHNYATDALERGVPIATVAELLGHVDTKMVSRTYSRLFQRTDHLKEALSKVRPGN